MARKNKASKRPEAKKIYKYPGVVERIRKRDDGTFMVIVLTRLTRTETRRETYVVRQGTIKVKEGQEVEAGQEVK